jgi:hypothetical protein
MQQLIMLSSLSTAITSQAVESEKKVEDPAILELLAQSIKKPKKKVGG